MEEHRIKWNPANTLTYKPRKEKRNVLTRMKKELSVGPFSLLHRSMDEHLRVRVWTRSFNHVRGICTGYVVAYDKHFNMAMCDVDEVYRNPRCLRREKTSVRKKRKRNRKKKDKNPMGSVTGESTCADRSDNISARLHTTLQIGEEAPESGGSSRAGRADSAPQLDGAHDSSSSGESQENETAACQVNEPEAEIEIFSAGNEFDEFETEETYSEESDQTGSDTDEELPQDEEELLGLLNKLKKELSTLSSSGEDSCEESDTAEQRHDSIVSERHDVRMARAHTQTESDSSCDGNAPDHSKPPSEKEPSSRRKDIVRRKHIKEKSVCAESDSGCEGNISDSSKQKDSRASFDLRQKILQNRHNRERIKHDNSEEKAHATRGSLRSRERREREYSGRRSKSRERSERLRDKSRDRGDRPKDRGGRDKSRERGDRERSADRDDHNSHRSPWARKTRRHSEASKDRARGRSCERKGNYGHDRVDLRDRGREKRDKGREITARSDERNLKWRERDKSKQRHPRSGSEERGTDKPKSRQKSRSKSRERESRAGSKKDTRQSMKSAVQSSKSFEKSRPSRGKISMTSSNKSDHNTEHEQGFETEEFSRRPHLKDQDNDFTQEEEDSAVPMEDVLCRHVNQLFIRGDNVVMISLVQ